MEKTAVAKSETSDDTPINPKEEFAASLKLTELVLSWIGLRVIYPKRPDGIVEYIKEEWLYNVSLIQLSITVVGEFIYLKNALGESFLEVTALAPCIGFCLLGICKMYVMSTKRHVIQKLVEELQTMWPTEKVSPTYDAIIQSSLRLVRSTTSFFFWLYVVLICFFNVDPLLVMGYDLVTTGTFTLGLPYFVWYPFDEFRSGVYQLIFVYQVWSGFIAAIATVGPDCMFQVSCSHICLLLKLLHEELLHIIPCPEDETSFEKIKNEDEIYHKLKSMVQRHQKIIKLSEDMETIYSFGVLVNLIASSFIICLVGFQATASDTKQLVKFSLFLISSLVQVLILSWYGNHLMETSDGLGNAAYNCKWYLAGPRFKVMLQILFLRSQRPLTVSAYKFSIISLNTFTSIVKTSWSYFTLLKTVYDPAK